MTIDNSSAKHSVDKYSDLKKRAIYLATSFIFFIFCNISVYNLASIYSLIIWLISLLSFGLFFFRFMSAFGKIRKEIEEKKAREEQAQEEARLKKIRESMTDAEWETYKLQMENNKLLRDIKKRGTTTKTTTTYGFSEEF